MKQGTPTKVGGEKMRVPRGSGRSVDGTPTPGLPAMRQNYIFHNELTNNGQDMPTGNSKFRVDVLRKQAMPDLPKQAGKNLNPTANKKILHSRTGSRAVK